MIPLTSHQLSDDWGWFIDIDKNYQHLPLFINSRYQKKTSHHFQVLKTIYEIHNNTININNNNNNNNTKIKTKNTTLKTVPSLYNELSIYKQDCEQEDKNKTIVTTCDIVFITGLVVLFIFVNI
jgi:hypothetical protein